MPLLNPDYMIQSDMSASEYQTPEASFRVKHDMSDLDNYSVRDDEEEQTSSNDETDEPERHEDSSLKSWFFKSKGKSNSDSSAIEATNGESCLSSDSVVAQGTPSNSRTGSPFRKSLRSFFKREGCKDTDVNDSKESVSKYESINKDDSADKSQQQADAVAHRFWKPWRGHHHRHHGENVDSNQENVETLHVAKEDDDEMLTHEKNRERNMERLTQQLMDYPSSDEEGNIIINVQERGFDRTQDAWLTNGDAHCDDDSNYGSSDSSTSSSIERAKEVKEKIGSVFSPPPENASKDNDISPLTPVDDIMDNPYKYIFEPGQSQANASVAYDCSWIDKNSVAFDNFDRALKLLTEASQCVSSLDGSLFTVSELSNEILKLVQNNLNNHKEVFQEKMGTEDSLKTVQGSFNQLKEDAEIKNEENVNLKAELRSLKEKYSHLEKDFESLSEEAEILTDEIAHSKKNIFALKDHERSCIESAQNEVDALKKELKQRTKDLEIALADKQSFQTRHDFMQSEHNSMKSEIDTLKAQNQSVQSKFESLKIEHDTLRTKQEFVQQEYESLKIKCDSLRVKQESMQAERDTMKMRHDALQGDFDSVQNDYKTVIFDNEILHEKNNILTTRLSDLVGSMSKVENGEREMRSDLEVSGNKLRRYENIIELLKIGNLKIQDNFRAERNKVLDLRRHNKILRRQLQLTECYRSQSLQYMSHMMFYYRGIVSDEALTTFDFHLKIISAFDPVTGTMCDDAQEEAKMKEHEAAVVKFYSKIARESFLDQIITKHVSYMRSNNFLSSQLSGLRKQVVDYENYASRLLQEIESCRKVEKKSHRKVTPLQI